MKPKLFIIFSLIVIIPTVTIIWLGVSLTKSERNAVSAQFDEVIKDKLQVFNVFSGSSTDVEYA